MYEMTYDTDARGNIKLVSSRGPNGPTTHSHMRRPAHNFRVSGGLARGIIASMANGNIVVNDMRQKKKGQPDVVQSFERGANGEMVPVPLRTTQLDSRTKMIGGIRVVDHTPSGGDDDDAVLLLVIVLSCTYS
eukprot:Lankesteria_metandrocarpae@DN7819_c0_g1_i1.p1